MDKKPQDERTKDMMTTAQDPFAGLAPATSKPQAAPAPTEKQERFYRNLLERKAGENLQQQDERIAKKKDGGHWTRARISEAIDALLKMPDAAQPAGTAPVVDEGMYREKDGTVLKVYRTVHGANQLVASYLNVTMIDNSETDHMGNCVVCGGGDVDMRHGEDCRWIEEGGLKYEAEFIYLGKKGLPRAAAARKLTEEEAKKLGQLYGFCVRCGKTLTLEESQHVGYGKTCAGHMGWWYPTRAELKAITATAEDPTKTINKKDEGR
jgi:hypothetical protein